MGVRFVFCVCANILRLGKGLLLLCVPAWPISASPTHPPFPPFWWCCSAFSAFSRYATNFLLLELFMRYALSCHRRQDVVYYYYDRVSLLLSFLSGHHIIHTSRYHHNKEDDQQQHQHHYLHCHYNYLHHHHHHRGAAANHWTQQRTAFHRVSVFGIVRQPTLTNGRLSHR